MAKHKLTKKKACTILHDKKVRGKPLSERQRKYMGARCTGKSKKG